MAGDRGGNRKSAGEAGGDLGLRARRYPPGCDDRDARQRTISSAFREDRFDSRSRFGRLGGPAGRARRRPGPSGHRFDTAPAPSPPVLEPIVANGRTDLHDGIYALRSGDTVTVHFDTPEARTRRAEKFELIVRATLPLTYGVAAEELLASTSPGTLAGDRDVVAELPGRGIHLRTSDGRELSIWPETRPGRDGPIVVSYRATRPH
jgi:hypothetical protein